MDADVEPVPCRDCGTPTLPNMGWCQDCDQARQWLAEKMGPQVGPRDDKF